MPNPKFAYEFVAHPAISDALKEKLDTPEKREAFLIRLAKTLGDNPRTAGEEIKGESFFRGKRKLPHLDDELEFCLVVFKMEGRTVIVYLVKPMD